MFSFSKKAAVVLFAAAMGLVVQNAHAAAVIVEGGKSATVSGWTISAPVGVSLAVDGVVNGALDIEKAANFTKPGQSYLVTFTQVSSSAPSVIDFTGEAVTNNSGTSWDAFQYLLLNTSTAGNAAFTNEFVPPTGTGVAYTSASLNADKDTLVYPGVQSSGSIANWGNQSATDELAIAVNGSTSFSLDEVPQSGGAVVPLPTAAWQALTGLLGLGLIGAGKKMLRFA